MDGLPGDILDAIIDAATPRTIVHPEDNLSLHTCSLVCRAWLPRTRHHLFKRRQVTSTFMKLLAADRCTFAPHVRELRLQWRSGHPDDKLHEHDAALLRRLTGVHTLELYLFSMPNIADARFHSAFLAHFVHVTRLEICYAFSGPDDFIADTICMFPLLTQLAVTASAPGASPGLPFVAPENLRELRLSNYGMSVLSGFCDSGSLRNLHSLDLPHISPETEPVVAAAFRALAGSLSHLHLHGPGDTPDAIDISPLVNLESFRIDLPPWATVAPYERFFLCISQLSSTFLETFSLRVSARGQRLMNWQAVDAFLLSGRFPRLKRFNWDLYGGYEHDSKYVLDNLPRLSKSSVTVIRSYL
ncbi:hypothetical protein DFH09DRAFT_1304240 [Mycena vulgaris]|nr:hypothetical protein DFH09DRAFT_1304240 [Mycena vulgaris]